MSKCPHCATQYDEDDAARALETGFCHYCHNKLNYDIRAAMQYIKRGNDRRRVYNYNQTVGLPRFLGDPVTVEQKPGRNEKCPCGSNFKYKNCCGGQV